MYEMAHFVHLALTFFFLLWCMVSLFNSLSMYKSTWASVYRIISLEHFENFDDVSYKIKKRALTSPDMATMGTLLMLLAMATVCVVLAVSIGAQLGFSSSVVASTNDYIVLGYLAWTTLWLAFLVADLWFCLWITSPIIQATHLIFFGIGVSCLLSIT